MGAGRTRFMRGPSFTYASVTYSLSTSTSLLRFSQLAIADRSTFSTLGAMRLLVVRRMLIGPPHGRGTDAFHARPFVHVRLGHVQLVDVHIVIAVLAIGDRRSQHFLHIGRDALVGGPQDV